jgi:hypothetical protein
MCVVESASAIFKEKERRRYLAAFFCLGCAVLKRTLFG